MEEVSPSIIFLLVIDQSWLSDYTINAATSARIA